MVTYIIGQKLTLLDREPQDGEPAVVLLTSEELDQHPVLAGLETTLHHLPPARDARVCKAEVRRDCLCGEVQASLWDKATLEACEKAGITLL